MPRWQDPSHTALIAAGPLPPGAADAVFRVIVTFAAADLGDGGRHGLAWGSETLAANEIALRTDPEGWYFAARIDLLLRSNAIATVVLDDTLPAGFRAAAQRTMAGLGYEVAELPVATAVAAWRDAPGAPSGWQATAKASALLPDLRTRLDPAHTAVVFIDVQNDFCHRDGATGRGGTAMTLIEETLPRLRGLLAAARQAGAMVVHVRAEYGQAFRSVGSPYRFPATGRRDAAVWTASAAETGNTAGFDPEETEVCLSGTWGAEFVQGMTPEPGEAVVVKHRYSAFRDTGLEVLLRANRISTLVFAGVTTNCCVESAVRDAAMRDFYTVVAEDCVAVKDRLIDLHEVSLEHMRLYFALGRPLDAIRSAWTSPPS